MKKTILFILGLSIIFFVASCKSETTNEDENQDTTENVVKNNNSDNNDDNLNQQDDDNFTEGTIELSEIELGDKINGLIVKGIDYTHGESFSIMFDGEFDIQGDLQMNPMDEIPEMYFNEGDLPPIKIKAEGKEHPFYMSLEFRNATDLINALSNEQKNKYQSGQLVSDVSLRVKNLTVGAYIPEGKGKIGSGAVDFVKLN